MALKTIETANVEHPFNGIVGEPEVKFGFARKRSPLPFEVEDSDILRDFFYRGKYLPYAGTTYETGHGLLEYYNSMYNLSHTHYSCIRSKTRYAFGGKLTWRIQHNNEFLSRKELSPNDTELDELEDIIINKVIYTKNHTIRKLIGFLHNRYHKNGNGWIEVVLGRTLGEPFAGVHIHKAEHCLKLIKEGRDQFVDISKSWDPEYIRRVKPKRLPIYPAYKEEKDGTRRFIVHVIQGDYTNYGRPAAEGATINMYREFQDPYYVAKEVDNEWKGKIIIEKEDGPSGDSIVNNVTDQAAGYKSTADRYRKNFTNQAEDASSFVLTSRSHGSGAMTLFQIKPNTNEKFHDSSYSRNEKTIIKVHDWDIKLLGDPSKAGLNKDSLIERLTVKDATVLDAERNDILNPINLIIGGICDWFGKPELAKNYLMAEGVFSKIKESLTPVQESVGLDGMKKAEE